MMRKRHIPSTLLLLLAVFAVGAGLLALGCSKGVHIGDNITYSEPAPISIGGEELRQWSDLKTEERQQIKKEVLEKFPTIKTDRDYRPVIKWLVEEKRVVTPSVRDLFNRD